MPIHVKESIFMIPFILFQFNYPKIIIWNPNNVVCQITSWYSAIHTRFYRIIQYLGNAWTIIQTIPITSFLKAKTTIFGNSKNI